MLTDSHAHLTDKRYSDDYEDVLTRAQAAGITTIINVGYDLPSSRAAVTLAAQTEGFFAAIGIHPHDAKFASDTAWQELRNLAACPKVVALGEIGLDYHYNHSPQRAQLAALRQQICLARELKLPIIIHDRDAHEEILAVLQEENANDVGGVMHCFSGTLDFARRCLDFGFYISLAGPVTFKNAGELARVAQYIPLDRLLIETDAPYLAPTPYRGKRNEPAYVRLVAEKIADIRGLDLATIAAATSSNARVLFALEKVEAKIGLTL